MFIKLKTRSHPSFSTLSILIFLLLTHLAIFMTPTASAEITKKDCLLDRACKVIAIKRDDLSIRSDLSTNPYTLSRFRKWMEAPIKAPIEAQQEVMNLFRTAKNPDIWFQELAKLGDINSSSSLPLERYSGCKLPTHLPKQLRKAIQLILDSIHTANIKLAIIKSEIPPEKIKLFEKYLYSDLRSEIDSEKKVKELDRTKELREAIDSAGIVDRRGIFEAGFTVIKALAEAKALLIETDTWHENVSSFSFMTDLGLVEIGGISSDVHENHAALIIDLGGDDLYKGEIASGTDGKCSIVLDLDGDDVYLGENYTQASGFWGVGVLFDLKGNDFYRATNYAQGAGLFGVGLLMDGGGQDNYLGATFVQAASSWGWGGLIDLDGEDTYKCQHSGQAYSKVLGISCLCDLSGNDKYISGAEAPDPREPDMNQSFSQGFAFGMRNLTGGGFALLADKSGNDLYQCQYFGQGASYWMGVGILYDGYGKDVYVARRYAQGAGIHFSFGLLMDAGGDDHTFSWGVSQGCGHDYGIGILINETGNDTYVSNWLSMGASEANGVGIFIDNSGDDGYETKTGMAVGHLIENRQAGGIGLFIDAGGKDRYSQKGCDNSVWGLNRWSIGIDENEGSISGLNLLPPKKIPTISEEAEKKRKKGNIRLSDILARSEAMPYPVNIEGMLSVASHWGLERKIPGEAREKLLNMDPEKSVPAMVDLLDTPNIANLIFMGKLFSIHAFHAIPELIKKTGDPNPLIKSRAYYYLGQLKDTRAVGCCVEALKNSSWRVKSGAIRAIGKILNNKRLEILLPMKETFDEALKKNDPAVIGDYLEDDKKIAMVLSILTRALSLDYQTYIKYAEIPSSGEKENVLKDYVYFVYDHMAEIIPLMEGWIRDINQSRIVAKKLMAYLTDRDPSVKRAAAYSLGQMHYQPAISELLTLLKDHSLWVRDAAVLSLALFGDDVLYPLGSKMNLEGPPFKIVALDVLARIKSDQSKALIEKYLNDSNQNVRRAARQALSNFQS